ncbi:MAG: hypothetical protein AB1473_11120 [Thermodesulfobacteriota bacterium]
MTKCSQASRCLCLAVVGFVGLLGFLGPSETPEDAVRAFVRVFEAANGQELIKIMHPDIVAGKEIKADDVQPFLDRYRGKLNGLKSFTIDKKLTSEDGKTQRFEATLVFQGPQLASNLRGPTTFEMTLLWVGEGNRWWLERPLSVRYAVQSTASYPSPEQEELAARFRIAVQKLDQLGLLGKEDAPFMDPPIPGAATDIYKELESLHPKERGPKGIDQKGRGLALFFKAAQLKSGGFLRAYHGDFKSGPSDKRRPMPWEVFRDYAQAAMKKGKMHQAKGQPDKAAQAYRVVLSFGRQILDEAGGYQFALWGLSFQKQAADELAKLWQASANSNRDKAATFANLVSRRLDLLQTAFSCLDDLADYRSIDAAIAAAQRKGDPNFSPWGINTLAILALKGAPAQPDVLQQAGAMVYMLNPTMQTRAQKELNELEAHRSGAEKAFIAQQKEWVQKHDVYGGVGGF